MLTARKLEVNKTLPSKKNKHFECRQNKINKKITGIRYGFEPTRYRWLLVPLITTQNISSFSEGPQNTLGEPENACLASIVPVGKDRLRKGK